MMPMRGPSGSEMHEQGSNGGYPYNGGGNVNLRGGTGGAPSTPNPVGLGGIRPPAQMPNQNFHNDMARPVGGGMMDGAGRPSMGGGAVPVQTPISVGSPVNFRSAPMPQTNPPTSLAHSPVNRTPGFADGQGLGGMRPLMSY